jgi:hypothetical protein
MASVLLVGDGTHTGSTGRASHSAQTTARHNLAPMGRIPLFLLLAARKTAAPGG